MERDQRERLYDLLLEDVGEDAEEFRSTIEQLHQWQAPQPTSESTDELVLVLEPLVTVPLPTRWQQFQNGWPWLLLKSQMRIVQTEIWLASVMIMAVGMVVSLAYHNPDGMLPLTFLAPVLSAFGVGMLYDGDALNMLELEDATPVSTRLLLLARMTLVFGFNLMLGLLGSVFLAIWSSDLSLWPLVVTWLVPMTFLSALAFFISVLASAALAGGLLSLILWSLHVFLRFNSTPHQLLHVLQMPGLSAPLYRPLLLLVAGLLTVVALWLAGMSDRRLKGTVA